MSQLTHEQVQALADAGKHDAIEEARLAGRLNHLLGITPQPTEGETANV